MKKKKWIALVIGLAAIVVLALIGIRFFGKPQEDSIIEKLMPETFSEDVESILNLFPAEVKKRAIEDTKTVYELEDDSKVAEQIGKDLKEWINRFDTQFGKDWKYEYEVVDTYTYTDEEVKNLEANYEAVGVPDISISSARIEMVKYTLTAKNGTEGTNTIPVCLIEQNGGWYLGQSIGQVYDKMSASDGVYYELYGDLLNGFSPVGVVTEDNEVIMFEDGTEVTDEEPAEDSEQVEEPEEDLEKEDN